MGFRNTLMWNAVSQFGQYGVQFISTVILARMLTPDDFGIIGMVAIFIALSQMVADSEMGGALLRKKNVDNADYSTLFWYNFGMSILIYAILYISAPFIAEFYDRTELIDIVRILSITVLINAFRIVQRVMIFRALRFKPMAIINVVSGLGSLAVAIYMANKGMRYWALVGQQIAKTLFDVILMQLFNKFIPRCEFSVSSFKYQFSFGISLLGSDTVKTIANNISTNIIAKFASLQFTGYYTQTSRITGFCQSLTGALMDQSIFPLMAKMESKEQIVNTYHRLMKYICVAGVPASILLIIFAKLIVRIILGDEWLDSTWMFRILSLSILPVCIQMLCRNILKVINVTKQVLILETVKSVLVIVSLLLGVLVGSVFIVWAVVISQILGAVIWLYYTSSALRKYNM